MPERQYPPQHVLGLSSRTVDYQEAWDLQQRLHRGAVEGEHAGAVLFLEHTSVYTAGKRTAPEDLPDDDSPVVNVDRGGKLTWHGPGQLVCYPVVALADPSQVKDYVWFLEETVIRVLAEHGLDAVRVDGRSGVWLLADEHRAQDEKIAAVGLRVTHGVAMHGLALNCSHGLEPYDHITACGISDAGVTTISREVGQEVTPETVLPRFRHHFTEMAPSYLAPVGLELIENSMAVLERHSHSLEGSTL